MASLSLRRLFIGLGWVTALVVLGSVWLASRLLAGASMLPAVHAPYPGTILLTQSVEGLQVVRRYQTLAPYRDVVEWYQGKDSLLPVPATLPPSCFQQSFHHSPTLFRHIRWGQIEELVTVCSTGGGATVETVTMVRPASFVPWRWRP